MKFLEIQESVIVAEEFSKALVEKIIVSKVYMVPSKVVTIVGFHIKNVEVMVVAVKNVRPLDYRVLFDAFDKRPYICFIKLKFVVHVTPLNYTQI